MIKGLYSSFSAMDAAWQYQDVLANNIANQSTIGYKREVAVRQSFGDVLVTQEAGVPAPFAVRIQDIVGQIGTGQFLAGFTTDFSPGSQEVTGEELDFALEDGFFAIEGPDNQVFYTRDGRFNRDANGDVVTSHGYYVLSSEGQHIRLPDSTVIEAETDGTLMANKEPIARLSIVSFGPGQLKRAGEAYFTSTEPGQPVEGGVRQGFLESSNSSIAEELTSMLAVQRAYQANQSILATLDRTLDQAAGELGSLT